MEMDGAGQSAAALWPTGGAAAEATCEVQHHHLMESRPCLHPMVEDPPSPRYM